MATVTREVPIGIARVHEGSNVHDQSTVTYVDMTVIYMNLSYAQS